MKTNDLLKWAMHLICYTLVLVLISLIFKNTIRIDKTNFGLWSLITALCINILNYTIRPFLIKITIPITALTFGIFYPFINVFILYIVDFILGEHFSVNGIFMVFIVAILISLINVIIDNEFLKPLFRKENK